jgi:surface carbohydrate biosynthesis protein
MINFYVPLEIKSRDFLGRLLLSLEVCKKLKWNIYFGFRGDVNYFAKNFTPGVYHGLATIRNFENLYQDIKKNGNLITISDEEGLVTYSEKYYSSFKISNKNVDLADLIFTWGEKNKKVLEKFTNKKKIVVSGNPRLDLLKPPFRSIYDDEIKKIREKYDNFFLICTNFSYTNYFDKNSKYSELLKKRNFFTSDEDLEEWYKYEKVKKKIFDELIKFLEKSNQVKDTVFVIRCHPSENQEIYELFQRKFKNVFLDNSYSVHPWILASKGVINHYCTTTFESLVAEKNVFTIKPDYKTKFEDEVFFKDTITVKNSDDLIKSINMNKEMGKNNNNNYCSIDLNEGHVSFQIIADKLSTLNLDSNKKTKKNNFILKYRLTQIFRLIKNKILFRTNNYIEHKIKIIDYQEIINFINKFDRYKDTIKVRKISKNFFLLTNVEN